jgi:hypothetical protein
MTSLVGGSQHSAVHEEVTREGAKNLSGEIACGRIVVTGGKGVGRFCETGILYLLRLLKHQYIINYR